jgi:hypothetical protein
MKTAAASGAKVHGVGGIQVVYQCGFRSCTGFFICGYRADGGACVSVAPVEPNLTAFPEYIRNLSPPFVAIYGEAEKAGSLGLKQIAGPGYRKAFEFLIKDYATSLVPDKAEEIKAAFSGTVVKDYIEDARIQGVASRCLWLGNDESHYLRRWEDKDATDLKALISLTVHWIEIEQLSKTYINDMPDKK